MGHAPGCYTTGMPSEILKWFALAVAILSVLVVAFIIAAELY